MSASLQGETALNKERFKFDNEFYVDLTIRAKDGKALSPHKNSDETYFSLQFGQGNKTIFRKDNSRGSLHYHDEKSDHVPVEEKRLAQIIAETFEEAKESLKNKVSDKRMLEGSDFIGFA